MEKRAEGQSRWDVGPIDVVRDLDEVLSVDRRSFSHPWGRAAFLHELDRSRTARIYVIRSRQAPRPTAIGYCVTWLIEDELHINNLAVDRSWREQGAGRALLDYVMSDARRGGARRATLEVRASNVAALRLYEGAGFVVAGTRREYYSEPADDALVMWTVLGEGERSLETRSPV